MFVEIFYFSSNFNNNLFELLILSTTVVEISRDLLYKVGRKQFENVFKW